MAGGSLGAPSRDLQRLLACGSVTGMADAQLVERFAVRRDEAAFAALVARHGPMVLATCRGILRDHHAAEDASQATFLVLARKAERLRVGETLGGWLHRVSLRIAVEAGRKAARGRAAERIGSDLKAAPCPDDRTSELLSRLHAEIDRLPEKYRVPIVLCDLQELTRDEVASRLGCPPGTVAGRLARARAILRERLGRRGLMPAGAMSVTSFAPEGFASAAPPPAWADGVTRGAVAFASRIPIAPEGVSAAAISLATEASRAMIRASLIKAATTVLGVGLAAGLILGARLLPTAKAGPRAASAAPRQDHAKRPKPAAGVEGGVTGPDGRASEGVTVFYSVSATDESELGNVVAEAASDAGGRFHLNIPEAVRPEDGAIWAYRPGLLVAFVPARPSLLPEGFDLRLGVGPPARAEFVVRAPDGSPVAGAKIRPRVLNSSEATAVPDALADRVEAETVTDARGRAVMTAFHPEDISTVFVTAPGFGSQQSGFGYAKFDAGPKVITVRPVGRVTGRLSGEPAEIRGRRLMVGTMSAEQPSPYPGLVFVTTDAEGRFQVPEIPAGRLYIRDTPNFVSPWYARSGLEQFVEGGRTTSLDLPLARGVPVSGVVRDETGAPIAGAVIGGNYGRSREGVSTDARGQFSGFLPPGQITLGFRKWPEGFARTVYGMTDQSIPEGSKSFDLPPIVLRRAGEVLGVVVNERGEPVVGALIRASWKVHERGMDGRDETTVRSGWGGRFVVPRVPLGTDVSLTAHHGNTSTPEAVQGRAGEGAEIRLRIDGSRVTSLAGRVLDPDGRPVAGAHIHLRRAASWGEGEVFRSDMLRSADLVPGVAPLVTDAEGRFASPRFLDRDQHYAAYIQADGFALARTDWTRASAASFADVTLTREAAPNEAR